MLKGAMKLSYLERIQEIECCWRAEVGTVQI